MEQQETQPNEVHKKAPPVSAVEIVSGIVAGAVIYAAGAYASHGKHIRQFNAEYGEYIKNVGIMDEDKAARYSDDVFETIGQIKNVICNRRSNFGESEFWTKSGADFVSDTEIASNMNYMLRNI